jgi:hypothetical protein
MVLISVSVRPASNLFRSAMLVIFCSLLVANSLSDPQVVTQRVPVAIALLACVACFFVIKFQMRPMAESVYDCGDYLNVSQGDKNVHIALSNIKDITYRFWVSPRRLTLTLVKPCLLGATVSFVPKLSLPGTHSIADELRDRARIARHTPAAPSLR